MDNRLLLLNVLKFASQQEWVKDVGHVSALWLGFGFWVGLWFGLGGEE